MDSHPTPPHPHRATASQSPTPPTSSSPSTAALTSSHTYQSFDDLVPTSPRTPTTRHVRTSSNRSRGTFGDLDHDDDDRDDPSALEDHISSVAEKTWNTLEFVKLTVAIAGAQLAWTVEMAYGTPYLLGLGLTKQGTSLVWMAGPLSGMLVQPIVGALSDSSPSRFRRRQYIAFSALFVLVSSLVVAYAREAASVLVSLFADVGDWDPARASREQACAIWIGVVGFYVLDFSLNALQAAIRALVLDLSPSPLQNSANAWLGRQTHIANVVGYLVGYLDLGHSPLLRWLGGGQFRKLAVTSCVVMLATVAVTCVTQQEDARPEMRSGESAWQKVRNVARDVVAATRTLPKPVRRVCYVQFFAWSSWFPFLFYSTTYVAEALYASIPRGTPPPSADTATRTGSFALLIYALVSLAAGTFIPYLTTLADSFPSLPSRVGPVGRLVLSELTPRNMWTVALAWYAACMVATFWATSVRGATAVVALVGVPWAITCWVPFALVMESIREVEAERADGDKAKAATAQTHGVPASPGLPSSSPSPARPFASPAQRALRTPFRSSLRQASWAIHSLQQPSEASTSPARHARPTSTSASDDATAAAATAAADEHTSLLLNTRSFPCDAEKPASSGGAGGTILGLHNLAIVLPQFFVALVAAGIFRLTTRASSKTFFFLDSHDGGGGEGELGGEDDVVWVLRFGGLASALGVVASRFLVETASERRYRDRVLYGWQHEPVEDDERRTTRRSFDSNE
ncbi:uncharacterized protein RHOBADRAFT_47279 [Rhodotorula graminis WP1]|uniref:General alpha-glucoside permease n=1 Tax=Rhodotorula graminis (strain WP1) TaxID=578459 RepID=A0A0P9GGT3_RHOGW|nr:uncharacterized protein RHOBADRAFT_47279 [Rhodotorula graminis WP1]KPV72096.1 hypothetical protein RHOBADRAFT_47279 [Rhodotorula graminis WP1]